jgi:hypothetical protein
VLLAGWPYFCSVEIAEIRRAGARAHFSSPWNVLDVWHLAGMLALPALHFLPGSALLISEAGGLPGGAILSSAAGGLSGSASLGGDAGGMLGGALLISQAVGPSSGASLSSAAEGLSGGFLLSSQAGGGPWGPYTVLQSLPGLIQITLALRALQYASLARALGPLLVTVGGMLEDITRFGGV